MKPCRSRCGGSLLAIVGGDLGGAGAPVGSNTDSCCVLFARSFGSPQCARLHVGSCVSHPFRIFCGCAAWTSTQATQLPRPEVVLFWRS